MPRSPADVAAGWPLWPLALLAGLLPLLATALATTLSMQQGLVPTCNPFVDGCTSISRAARYELPNQLFRAIMLPAATLQALVWLLVARWLLQGGGGGGGGGGGADYTTGQTTGRITDRITDRSTGRATALIGPLGLVAGVALVVYGSFLGVEGPVYRWLRQYGTVVYFGFTCLNLLLTGRALQQMAKQGRLRLQRMLERSFVVLAVALVMLGLVNAIVAAVFGEPLKGRMENVTEWWGGLIFVLGFFAIAALWRRERLVLQLGVSRH